jgi:hypothetical protein
LEVGRVVIGQKIKMGGKKIFHKIPLKKLEGRFFFKNGHIYNRIEKFATLKKNKKNKKNSSSA